MVQDLLPHSVRALRTGMPLPRFAERILQIHQLSPFKEAMQGIAEI